MSGEEVLEVASRNAPYFRTAEFSKTMLDCEKNLLTLADAPKNSRVVFLTGSGTAGMEAALLNTLSRNDKLLIVKGGSFGTRFCEIAEALGIPFEPIEIEMGKTLHKEDLDKFEDKGFTAFAVNLGETSTGVLYDIDLISDFCNRNNLFLIVDAVSTFLAEEISMEKSNIGALITGSQKALATMPGVALVFLSSDGIKRVENNKVASLYFDFKNYLLDGTRGQTPFTPAVSTLLQIAARVEKIIENGGVEYEIKKTADLANYFRTKIADYPFTLFAEVPSNAVTSLKVQGDNSAVTIFETLKNEYDIFICPNGGSLKETVFRVGHIGALETTDYDELFSALDDMKKRGIIK
ncbi:MAG: alanine--glyoxylate aminotransferase family protein [Clostridia bacterium]|nr:alanine--glyoxylate aminotransferase family protein [Clostridia bacterium]